jgi:hypothetical protein
MISAYHPEIAEPGRTTVGLRVPARLLPSADGERQRATWLTVSVHLASPAVLVLELR